MKVHLLGMACAALFVNAGTAYGFSFTDLGELSGAITGREALSPTPLVGISGNGSTLFTSTTRWTAAGGWQTWDSYTGGAVTDGVRAVSSDGSVVAGNHGDTAYHWSAATGVTSLGNFPSYYSFSAIDISADGSVVVGTGTDTRDPFGTTIEAFRWTATGGMVGLGLGTSAEAISPNGTIVAGSTGMQPESPAFWTEGENWTTLDRGGELESLANGVTDNGTLIVSRAQSKFFPPRLWSPGTAYSDLGDPLIVPFDNLALDMSADGRIVVGSEGGVGCPDVSDCFEAWVWDEANGRRSIETILTTEGIDLSNWEYLGGATSVSADGSFIVGSGLGTDGLSHGWLLSMAPVPIPPALYLFITGLLGLVGVARRKAA